MSFAGHVFSKLGLSEPGMASFLSQYKSPPSRPADEHDLAELSPRPEDALLEDDTSDHGSRRGSAARGRGEGSVSRVQTGGADARAKGSVTFQDSPWSPDRTGDGVHDYRAGKGTYQRRQPHTRPPATWRHSFASDTPSPRAETAGPQLSFFESMFAARPAYSERAASTKVDQSFKWIERRERQMQQELQQLLDAQDYALEKHLANTMPDGEGAQRAGAPRPDASNGHVIPVRQPKKRPLTKREARLGIARCMSQLSDLKNEEEAYIATALGERKAALSRLRSLSTKRDAIVAEMQAIESDRDRPPKNEIRKMEHQHRAVCEDISELEARLRELKRTKTRLEGRIAEAKSARDSELSGYKGALTECDKRAAAIMSHPDVAVLEVEGLMAQDAELSALAGQRISGLEFLSLRPERRTLPMAKDWWEGEVQVLELRKAAVDKERAALDEGTQLWQDMVRRLEEHDGHLKATFDALAEYLLSSQQQQQQSTPEFNDLGEILKKQYAMCQETARELENMYEYAEAQGWNLLVTVLGAEINYSRALEAQLGDTLRLVGWADGVVTAPATHPPAHPRDGDGRLSASADHGEAGGKGLEDDLTGSVLRRWDATDELLQRRPTPPPYADDDDDEANKNREDGGSDNDNDNEVPPGLFGEERRESEDEDGGHNDVPPEFLSMHSPSPRSRGKAKGKNMRAASEPGDVRGVNGDRDVKEGEDGEKMQRPLKRRESSVNGVPPDLLVESHRSVD
ncbi:hypothetical protein F4802DRAFT_531762 [Xylaria palmicola]|nr:hypothetical protein F4802DRAFT_531762 [Xylaria palmicola]